MTMADLWRAARKQVSDFEHRSAELGLVLSTEKAALKAVQAEVKTLEEGARGGTGPALWAALALTVTL